MIVVVPLLEELDHEDNDEDEDEDVDDENADEDADAEYGRDDKSGQDDDDDDDATEDDGDVDNVEDLSAAMEMTDFLDERDWVCVGIIDDAYRVEYKSEIAVCFLEDLAWWDIECVEEADRFVASVYSDGREFVVIVGTIS